MSGIASNAFEPPRFVSGQAVRPRPRSQAKRSRIVEVAMQHFAENGYHAARVGDMAAVLGIAKGSIFQHFGSKDGLFFEVYKRAVRCFPKYLDAPEDIRTAGFFEVLHYWLKFGRNIYYAKTGSLIAFRCWAITAQTSFSDARSIASWLQKILTVR